MDQFFKENKTFIAIILAAFIIGGFIYLSNRSSQLSVPLNKNFVEQNSFYGENTDRFRTSNLRCIDYTEAQDHIGEYTCVRGRVDHVYTSKKGNNFLNFCPDYRTCPFSAVIFNSDAYKFSDIKSYSGKVVEITGLIKTYKGRAEIIINDPNQIKIK